MGIPPSYRHKLDNVTESSVAECLTLDSNITCISEAPVHAGSGSSDQVLEPEVVTTARVLLTTDTIPPSGCARDGEGANTASRTRIAGSPTLQDRPSSVAALHEELGLLGTPSVSGIKEHVQGLRRRARLLKRQLHGDGDASGASPDPRVPLKDAPSNSGLQGPGHAESGHACVSMPMRGVSRRYSCP